MMSFVRDLYRIVTIPFTCPKCGHSVAAEIDFDKPLNVGNQCPKCIECYPQEFSNAVIRATEKFWSNVDGS